MNSVALSRVLGLAAILCFLVPATASAQDGCFSQLADCFRRAAMLTYYWDSLWASLDCELELITCIRIAVIGR